jgi:hypothetical protein
MPCYEYLCNNGHRTERVASLAAPGEPLDKIPCPECKKVKKRASAELVPSLTGKPKLKAGIGGFHNPNA